MENFTPISSLLGGAMIGAGALVLMAFLGRIAGISGITSSAIFSADGRAWRLAFVVGLLVGPLVVGLLWADFSYATPSLGWEVVVAGLLVGIGTGIGSGCTSGHGICGIGRLSMRSIVATLVFMAAGFLIATLFTQGAATW
ncbi:MAG: YeeE/YedE family protein [Idiomarina sp.]|nr:YeeE/YedE family protein [Idiomarina sp.]